MPTLVDPDTKARSLLTDSSGAPVISRLDGQLLRDIALATEGAYVPAGVSALDIESIVSGHIEPIVRDTDTIASVRTVPNEHYQWFVLAALVFAIRAIGLGAVQARSESW